jgi:hypothetical protein
MNLTERERNFIVAAYVISEGDTDRRLESRAITSRAHFHEEKNDWVFEDIANLASLGLLVPNQRDGNADVQFVQLTSAGARKAVQFRDVDKIEPLWISGRAPDHPVPTLDMATLFEPDATNGVPHSDGSIFSDGTGYAQTSPDNAPHPIASESWTGIPSAAVVEGDKLVQLKAFVADADKKLETFGFENNRDRAQALALIAAIRIAADAPDPPLSAILQLLAHLNNIAGIGSFLISLGTLAALLASR